MTRSGGARWKPPTLPLGNGLVCQIFIAAFQNACGTSGSAHNKHNDHMGPPREIKIDLSFSC